MNYSDMEQAIEAGNFAACREAFTLAFPDADPAQSEECGDAEFRCPTCPWRKFWEEEI